MRQDHPLARAFLDGIGQQMRPLPSVFGEELQGVTFTAWGEDGFGLLVSIDRLREGQFSDDFLRHGRGGPLSSDGELVWQGLQDLALRTVAHDTDLIAALLLQPSAIDDARERLGLALATAA